MIFRYLQSFVSFQSHVHQSDAVLKLVLPWGALKSEATFMLLLEWFLILAIIKHVPDYLLDYLANPKPQ